MFDIASLKIEGDATDLTKLVSSLDSLTAASERYHSASGKVRTATERANVAHQGLRADIERLTVGTDAFSRAEAAALRVTDARISATRRSGGAYNDAARAAIELARATREAEREEARAARSLQRLRESVDPLAGAVARANTEIAEWNALVARNPALADEAARSITALNARIGGLNDAQGKVAAGAKLTQRELMNLSFQANDVFTSLLTARDAGDVFRVLGQQSGQVAQVFQEAGARGVTFGQAIGGIAQSVGGLAMRFAPLLVILGTATAAFGIFSGEVNKQTKYATTWADTWNATVKVVGDAIMSGPIGTGLKWLGGAFSATLQAIVAGTLAYTDRVAGLFYAGYQAVVKNWRQLPMVFATIMQAAANTALWAVEGIVNTVIKGINHLAGKELIKALDLPEIKAVTGKIVDDFEKDMERGAAASKAAREQFLKDVSAQADKEFLARQKSKKAAKERESEYARAVKAADEYIRKLREEVEAIGLTEEAQRRLQIARAIAAAPLASQKAIIAALGEERERALALAAAWDTLKASEDAARQFGMTVVQAAEAKAMRDYADAVKAAGGENTILAVRTKMAGEASVKLAEAVALGNVELVKVIGTIPKVVDSWDDWIARMTEAVRKYQAVQSAGDELFDGIRNRDWAQAFSGLLRALDLVKKAFDEGTKFDKVNAVAGLADAAGRAIGGKGGRALSSASSAGAMAFQFSGGNPVVAGVAAAVAGLAELIKSKPSNAGAGYSLVTGEITGRSRTAETERAVLAASGAIRDGQDALRAAGLTLTETIHGVVIGSRDLSQAYTTGGRTITAAIGDAAATTEAALRAVLETATFASAEQEKLAKSALAAGKSFDDVMAILDQYAEAQKISGNLADEILRLTDPKAFDLKGVADDIAAQRKAYQQLATDGYLTSEQLQTINGQLATLEGLRIDEVMKRYADATEAAAAAQEEAIARFNEQIRVGLGAADVTGTTAAERQHRVARENRERAEARAAAENVEALAEQAEAARVAREALVRLGDVAGLLATDLRGRRGSLDNAQISAAEASAARALAIELSSRALEVSNIGAVMDQLQARVNPYASGYVMRGWAGEASQALREALGPLASAVEQQQQGSIYGSGIAGVRAGRFALEQARADRTAQAYAETQSRLNGALARGEITSDEYAKAIATVSRYAEALGGQAERIEQARFNLGVAGASSVVGYLDAISKSVAGLNAAAREAADPVTQMSDAIGRLNSLATVLAEGVQAAADGGSLGRGLLSTANAETALTIANAAAIAAQALTTSEAKRIAADLAKQAAFDGVTNEKLREAAFLIEGIRAFDPASFEAGFNRLNDALIRGAVSQAQYDALFAQALGTFQGAAEGATDALNDLRKGIGSLADKLLLGEFSTLSDPMRLGEAERQYRAALVAARSGKGDAGAVESSVDALLGVGRATAATEAEFNRLFGSVYSDLRGMETDLRDPTYRTADAAERIADNTDGLKATIEELKAELKTVQAKLDTGNGYAKSTANSTRQAVTGDGLVEA